MDYNRLFRLLVNKEMRRIELAEAVGISANTLAKLSQNDTAPVEVIIKICRCLNCITDDAIEILPETRME